MKFRAATQEDHELFEPHLEGVVSDNEEGPRYWIIKRPYAFGQRRLQIWHERRRGEAFPAIFSEM